MNCLFPTCLMTTSTNFVFNWRQNSSSGCSQNFCGKIDTTLSKCWIRCSQKVPSSFWQNRQHRKQHAVFLSKKRKHQRWARNNCSHYFTSTSVAGSENQIKIGHRNLESQQNDNNPRSVDETSLKQEKLEKRSKSTKCYIHFHKFPESSAKNFNVVSHLKVSQIPKIKSK